jgi:hypothetical protein
MIDVELPHLAPPPGNQWTTMSERKCSRCWTMTCMLLQHM